MMPPIHGIGGIFMQYSREQLLWLFLIYAFLGWCTEVAYAAVSTGKFVNRGMVNGPVCPIYGLGVLLVLLLLKPLTIHPLLLFLGAAVITTGLEFLTGWVLERIFHDKWWDYSDQPFNLRGYVCLKFSLLWGLACLLVVYVVHPSLLLAVERLCGKLLFRILLAAFLCAFAADVAVTFIQLAKLPHRLQAIEDTERRIRELSHRIGTHLTGHVLNAAAILEDTRDTLQEDREALARYRIRLQQQLDRQNFIHERLLRAFPALEKGRHKEAIARLKAHRRQK